MLVTVDGIVIGRRGIGENSAFLDVLTDEYGVIEVTAHGVKKLTSGNAGSTSLFSYSTFCLNKSGARYSINSSVPKCNFIGIASNIEALSLAAYFAELIRYCSASESEGEKLLRFMAMTLYELEKERIPLRQIKAVFELRLASRIGFMPDLRACAECIAYESPDMRFFTEDGMLLCGDCYGDRFSYETEQCFLLSPSLLYTMRFIVYSDLKKIYLFKTGEKTLRELSAVTEKYLLTQLGRAFDTLDYYKDLTSPYGRA